MFVAASCVLIRPQKYFPRMINQRGSSFIVYQVCVPAAISFRERKGICSSLEGYRFTRPFICVAIVHKVCVPCAKFSVGGKEFRLVVRSIWVHQAILCLNCHSTSVAVFFIILFEHIGALLISGRGGDRGKRAGGTQTREQEISHFANMKPRKKKYR